VVLPGEADYAKHVYHLYVIRAEDRDALRDHLHEQGVATGIHYPVPIHLQPAYLDLGYDRGSFPVTEECAGQLLSLPMYPELTPGLIERVAETVENWAGKRTTTPSRPHVLADRPTWACGPTRTPTGVV
jgi:dTDP-4-amino-4,6-dideoxygalactose transaminase